MVESPVGLTRHLANDGGAMKIYFAIFISLILASCGGDQGSTDQSAAGDTLDDAAAEYQEKVSAKVSDSMVNSFVREWGVSEDEARCVVSNIKTSELMRVETDPDVQARLKDCGVDPAVVK